MLVNNKMSLVAQAMAIALLAFSCKTAQSQNSASVAFSEGEGTSMTLEEILLNMETSSIQLLGGDPVLPPSDAYALADQLDEDVRKEIEGLVRDLSKIAVNAKFGSAEREAAARLLASLDSLSQLAGDNAFSPLEKSGIDATIATVRRRINVYLGNETEATQPAAKQRATPKEPAPAQTPQTHAPSTSGPSVKSEKPKLSAQQQCIKEANATCSVRDEDCWEIKDVRAQIQCVATAAKCRERCWKL